MAGYSSVSNEIVIVENSPMRLGFEGILRIALGAFRNSSSVMAAITCFGVGGSGANTFGDIYRYGPPSNTYFGRSSVDTCRVASPGGSYLNSYQVPSSGASGDARRINGEYRGPDRNPGNYSTPSTPPPSASRDGGYYSSGPPFGDGPPVHESYSKAEIIRAGNKFFSKVSGGLASVIEWVFQKAGRPNGYILGEDAGGAFIAGLAYGEGTLYTKNVGTYKVYWQGPSVGYDFGGDGSKVMTLVYNLRDPSDIYERFGGVEGAAYLISGVSVQLQKAGHVTLAPIHAGVGLRLGANVGYLKYTRNPTWNPF